jgi:uncharacterized delta-60 repeat protein
MVMVKGAHIAVYLLVSVIFLSGCGGGGNGGAGGSSPSPTGSASAFNQARGFDNGVTGLVPVNDGSGDVFAAGSFTTYTDIVSNRLIRLHADGTVAQAFPDGFNDGVRMLVSARDDSGAMYALGAFTQFNGQPAAGFIRLNRDGSRDTNFQLSAMDQPPTAVATIPGGSGAVYIGGPFTNYGGTAIRHLARLRANGSLDQSFSPGVGFTGIQNDSPDPNDLLLTVERMAVEEIGSRRLYVQGLFGSYRGMSVPGFLRILTSGEIDPTFVMGSGPGVSIFTQIVETLLPAADGKVYVGGRVGGWNGESAASFGLLRVNENGSLDRTFVPPMLITLMIASAGDTTGDIYVSGFDSSNPSRFRRLRPDGSPATTFQEPAINDQVRTVVPVGDGSTDVNAGGFFTAYAGNGVNHLARVRSDGTLAGPSVHGSGFSYDVMDMEPGEDGSVYVITFPGQFYNGTAIRPLVRLLSNGTLDPGFLFREDVIPGSGVFIASVTRARNDSRIYVTGTFTEYDGSGGAVASVMRLFADGSLDQSFVTGRGFHQVIPTASLDTVVAPKVVPAGSPAGALYAFGDFSEYNGRPVPNLVRLVSHGALDPGFSIGSGFEGSFGPAAPSIVIANEDGSIYVSGFFDTFNGQAVRNIVRLDSTGRLDPSFVPPTAVQAFAAAPDRSVFVNAPGTSRNAVLRKLRPDGSVDASFNSDPLPGAFISQVIALSNDRVAVVGVMGSDPGASRSTGYVMVLDAAGRQDSTFGLRTMTNVFTTPPSVAALADDGTGDIFLGGAFTRYEKQTMQRIARLNSDGSAD